MGTSWVAKTGVLVDLLIGVGDRREAYRFAETWQHMPGGKVGAPDIYACATMSERTCTRTSCEYMMYVYMCVHVCMH